MALFMVDVNGVAVGKNVELPAGFAISKKARRVKAYALTGGGAAGDTIVALNYNGRNVVDMTNTDTDDIPDKQEIEYISSNYVLGAYQPLELEVKDASPSACYAMILIQDLGKRR